MRPLGNHVHAAILRAVTRAAGLDAANRHKPILTVESVKTTDWASATFVGALHDLALRITGSPAGVAEALVLLGENLPECDIPIAGHIVAEIGFTPGIQHSIGDDMIANPLTVNVLTIVD